MISDIWFVLVWLIFLMALQYAVFIPLHRVIKDIAYPVSFTISILLFSIICWYLTLLGIPNYYIFFPLVLLIGYNTLSLKKYPIKIHGWKNYLLVFFGCFLIMLAVRITSPNILDMEKFMDFGYIHSIYRYSVIPPVDIWYGGEPLSVYYYYGFWIFASLGKILQIPPQILFNLASPTIFSLSAINLYAFGKLFLKKYEYLPLMILCLPNPDFCWSILSGTEIFKAFSTSILVIYGTDNEYMLASFLIGDVHPHIISFIIQTLLLVLLGYCAISWPLTDWKSKCTLSGLIALSLGVLVPLNIWGIFLFAPLIVITGIWIALSHYKKGIFNLIRHIQTIFSNRTIFDNISESIKKPITSAILFFLVLIPVSSILLYFPYYIQSQGNVLIPGLVHTPSSLIGFCLVWGFFILVLSGSIFSEIKKYPWYLLLFIPGVILGYGSASIIIILLIYFIKRNRDYLDILIITGLVLLLLCEFIYLNDYAVSVHYRFNTVFKIYSMVWIILGTASLIFVARFFEENQKIDQIKHFDKALTLLVIFSIIGILPLSVALYGFSDPMGLRGDAFLEKSIPYDAHAIDFLRNLTGSHLIIEPAGFYNMGTYEGRISVFSGIPTLIGWYDHIAMWRQHLVGAHAINERVFAVKLIYEDPDVALTLMDAYGADLLYVGPIERKSFNISLPIEGLDIIYDKEGVKIYERNNIPTPISPLSISFDMVLPNLLKMEQGFEAPYRKYPI